MGDRTGRNVFQDERGSWSFARVALAVVLANILGLCWWVVLYGAKPVENAIWTILTTIASGLITWAAGPRIAQHLAPMFGQGITAVGQAIRPTAAEFTRDPATGDEATPAR